VRERDFFSHQFKKKRGQKELDIDACPLKVQRTKKAEEEGRKGRRSQPGFSKGSREIEKPPDLVQHTPDIIRGGKRTVCVMVGVTYLQSWSSMAAEPVGKRGALVAVN